MAQNQTLPSIQQLTSELPQPDMNRLSQTTDMRDSGNWSVSQSKREWPISFVRAFVVPLPFKLYCSCTYEMSETLFRKYFMDGIVKDQLGEFLLFLAFSYLMHLIWDGQYVSLLQKMIKYASSLHIKTTGMSLSFYSDSRLHHAARSS